MAGPPKDIDVRTEMAVSLFWRGIIGDAAYAQFDPDDLLRWYFALQLRGPEEIRDLWTERYSGRPMGSKGEVVGVVGQAPHPPQWLVREWLEHEEPKPYFGVPIGLGFGFLVLSIMFFPMLHGCQDLVPDNPLAMNPPTSGIKVQPYSAGPPGLGTAPGSTPMTATLSTNTPGQNPMTGGGAPVAPATPAGTATATGPQSGGIAAGASATSATGPTSSGISAAQGH